MRKVREGQELFKKGDLMETFLHKKLALPIILFVLLFAIAAAVMRV